MPTAARNFLLLVEIVAFGSTIALLRTESMSAADLLRLVALAVMALGYAEAGARIERLKRYLSPGGDKVVSNQVSVWAFAAALTVPAGWAAVLVGALYLQSVVRRYRDKTGVPYRVIFAGATVMISVQAASAVLAGVGIRDEADGGRFQPLAILVALLIFTLVNFGVLVVGMWLTKGRGAVRGLLPDSEALGYEIATLVLGIMTAELLVHAFALTPVVLILAAYLHRSSLVNALHRASRIDNKTALPNLTAWTDYAENVLSRSHDGREPVSVLFCDLDHFKTVNDTYGHLFGDEVLVSVAQCLRAELRGRDGVGRFGGEEFVVILDALRPADAEKVATRIRTAVRALSFDNGVQITMSVGVAHEAPGQEPPILQQLLTRADTALRTAKADGRDRVRVAR